MNYGTSGTNNIYVFYGGNDGVFRAIKGGQPLAAPSGRVSLEPCQVVFQAIAQTHVRRIVELRSSPGNIGDQVAVRREVNKAALDFFDRVASTTSDPRVAAPRASEPRP